MMILHKCFPIAIAAFVCAAGNFGIVAGKKIVGRTARKLKDTKAPKATATPISSNNIFCHETVTASYSTDTIAPIAQCDFSGVGTDNSVDLLDDDGLTIGTLDYCFSGLANGFSNFPILLLGSITVPATTGETKDFIVSLNDPADGRLMALVIDDTECSAYPEDLEIYGSTEIQGGRLVMGGLFSNPTDCQYEEAELYFALVEYDVDL